MLVPGQRGFLHSFSIPSAPTPSPSPCNYFSIPLSTCCTLAGPRIIIGVLYLAFSRLNSTDSNKRPWKCSVSFFSKMHCENTPLRKQVLRNLLFFVPNCFNMCFIESVSQRRVDVHMSPWLITANWATIRTLHRKSCKAVAVLLWLWEIQCSRRGNEQESVTNGKRGPEEFTTHRVVPPFFHFHEVDLHENKLPDAPHDSYRWTQSAYFHGARRETDSLQSAQASASPSPLGSSSSNHCFASRSPSPQKSWAWAWRR